MTTQLLIFSLPEDSSMLVTPENEAEHVIKEDNSHLKELHSYVTGCEENLTKHK